MHDGEFDDLPGKGKPINFKKMSNVPAHLRAGYQLLKNSGFVPEEVRLKKEMESIKLKIKSCANENELKESC
jgi:septation ring formation regulator EzrA